MTIKSFATHFGSSLLGVLVIMSTWSAPVRGQHDYTNAIAAKSESSELVRIVREGTERFKDPAVADGEGYKLAFGCVSRPGYGAIRTRGIERRIADEVHVDEVQPQIL